MIDVIQVSTLIDITNSNVRPGQQTDALRQDQFRNWATLIQCIGLRSIIDFNRNPVLNKIDITGLGFGTEYNGIHNVWTFQFRTDRQDTFTEDGDPLSLLKQDLDKVPIITNLKETINIEVAKVFELTDSKVINTVLKVL
jgi:hypothetical protein